MSGFWKGYANVNDDVRHTYEQVFFGRQTTGNLTESDVPGMKPEAPQQAAAPDAGATGPGVTQEPTQHEHAEFYGSVWGNGDAPPVGVTGPEGGPAPTQGGAAAQVEAPPIEAPPIEAPSAAPSQGNDMTPGY